MVPAGAVLQRGDGLTEVQHVLDSSKENEFPVVDTNGTSDKSIIHQHYHKFEMAVEAQGSSTTTLDETGQETSNRPDVTAHSNSAKIMSH